MVPSSSHNSTADASFAEMPLTVLSARQYASTAPEERVHIPGKPLVIGDHRHLWLRPIRPTDITALQRCFTRLSEEEIRMRFFYLMRELPLPMATRLCKIDPTQEAAWVLEDNQPTPTEIRGVGRVYWDASCNQAEFSVLVEKAWTGYGLGAFLLQLLVDYCREQKMNRIWGYVLIQNRPMMNLCRKLGFVRRPLSGDPGTALIALDFPSQDAD